MKYMGSKNRFAKELLPIILKDRLPNQWYYEPMVGGANMIDKVDGNRFGSDINECLISMWNALTEGWLPQEKNTMILKTSKANTQDMLLAVLVLIVVIAVNGLEVMQELLKQKEV